MIVKAWKMKASNSASSLTTKLLRIISALVEKHRIHVRKRWFGPLPMTTWVALLTATFVCIAAAGNIWVRFQQLEIWQASPTATELYGAPLFSTADAPYFMLQARSIQAEQGVTDQERIRYFPNLVEMPADPASDRALRSRSLLPVIMASIAEGRSTGDLLWAGNLMIIVSAGLTALMITVCFGAAGYWAEGAIAGLGGGLSAAYIPRSSIGRIDTDQMNLGFMYLMFGLVMIAGRADSRRTCLLWCALAGLCANLFTWWYGKPELIVMAAIALAWLLACLQSNILTAISGTAIFILISGITFFNPLESAYLQTFVTAGNFIFPNALETVSEVRMVPFLQILTSATGSVEMSLVCISGLLLFGARHPALAFAYGPLVAFGLLNFVIGNRAIFYSGPILWFGAAFLLTTTAKFVAYAVSEEWAFAGRERIATMAAASLAMAVAWVNSPTDYLPRPSFPKPVLEGLIKLQAEVNPRNSVVATWWDYGYASMFLNGLPTLHDGGSQTTPTTHFVARAFLEPSQRQMVGRLKFLSTKGNDGIQEKASLAELKLGFGIADTNPSPDLYLVVTSQMAGWMGAISQIGNWDIERGEPVELRGNPNGPLVNYERLNCRLGGYPQKLLCTGTAFDLERGLVNGAPVLAGWAHSQDGTTVRGKSFDHDGDFAVQIVQTGNRISVFLMHRQLFESSFNELFYLGQIDHPSISLHYDNFPHIRIYKIDGEPEG